MIASWLALLLLQPPEEAEPPHVISVHHVDLGYPLNGSDYLLIAEAARHPAMRGANLSCFRIYAYDEDGARRIAFVEARDRVVERPTPTGTTITYLPHDPTCRSISFVMDDQGRVARVIRTRPDHH